MFAAVSALGVSRDPVCLCAKTRTQDSHERGRTSMGTNTVHNPVFTNTNTNTVTHSKSPCGPRGADLVSSWRTNTVHNKYKYRYNDLVSLWMTNSTTVHYDVFLFKVQYVVEHAMAHNLQGCVFSWASSSNFCVNAIHEFDGGLLEEGHSVTTQSVSAL